MAVRGGRIHEELSLGIAAASAERAALLRALSNRALPLRTVVECSECVASLVCKDLPF